MTTEKKEKGSCFSASGMALMAHKFGVETDIQVNDTNISDEVFEYDVIFRDAPAASWSLDPKDEESVTQNRGAVIFAIALDVAARNAYCLGEESEIGNTHFHRILFEQSKRAEQIVVDFLAWYGNSDCRAVDLHDYLNQVFEDLDGDDVAEDVKVLCESLQLGGGLLSHATIREILWQKVTFRTFKHERPTLYPTWNRALWCACQSCK